MLSGCKFVKQTHTPRQCADSISAHIALNRLLTAGESLTKSISSKTPQLIFINHGLDGDFPPLKQAGQFCLFTGLNFQKSGCFISSTCGNLLLWRIEKKMFPLAEEDELTPVGVKCTLRYFPPPGWDFYEWWHNTHCWSDRLVCPGRWC